MKEKKNLKTRNGLDMTVCQKSKDNKAITLIVLIITIVVMLILVSVTITVSINGGLFGYAKKAKYSTEIADEIEIIDLAIIRAKANERSGELIVSKLEKELENYDISIYEEGTIIVKFNEKNRYYEIDEKENVENIEITGEKILTIECIDSTEEIIGQKTYTILRNKYVILLPEIEGYEASEERIEGEIEENKTIKVIYYLIAKDENTLLFTGLNSSGQVTTNENETVAYMVGDGSKNRTNALKENKVQSIVKVPLSYNGKPVTQIGSNAFSYGRNIISVYIEDNIETILDYAFYNTTMEYLEIGKKVASIAGHVFLSNPKLETILFKNSMNSYGQCFSGCNNWKYTLISDDNSAYKVEDNILYSEDGKTLIVCPKGLTGEFITNNTVENIAKGAFWGCKFDTLITTANVKAIGDYAFSTMSTKNFVIGENINSLPYHIFSSSSPKMMIINSSLFVGNITKENSYQLAWGTVDTIYIKDNINTIGSYIIDNYTIENSDKEGYIKYIKKQLE